MRRLRLQSAMEYLLTYGWAILIIAVVLGALFQLGVFNASTFAPRAPPGACQVFRPNGPNTASLVNLEGVCSGELPQYVGVFNSAGHVTLGASPIAESAQSITVTAWVRLNAYDNLNSECQEAVAQWGGSGNPGVLLRAVNGPGGGCGGTYSGGNTQAQAGIWAWGNGATQYNCVLSTLPLNSWSFLALTYNGFYLTGYVGSTQFSCSTGDLPLSLSEYTLVGSNSGGGDNLNGSIADIQIYNTSLSGPEVTALYDEGIGGSPIKLQNLVGWWPLNGNANDYSGNNNNGVPSGVTYTSQWTSGYTTP